MLQETFRQDLKLLSEKDFELGLVNGKVPGLAAFYIIKLFLSRNLGIPVIVQVSSPRPVEWYLYIPPVKERI